MRQSAVWWVEGNAFARVTATPKPKTRLPVGTTFSFTLDQAASVTLVFTQSTGGRKVGKRCLAPTKHNKKRPRCSRTITAGTLHFSAHARTNTVHFAGRLSARSKLRTGAYMLIVLATNGARKSSASRPLRFTIVKG